jgi:hypothetical protein
MMQFTTVLLILAIAIAGYFFWAMLPAYEDNYTARQSIEGVVNQGWKKTGKEEIHKQILEKLSTIGSHVETPAGGVPVEVRGLPIDDDSVVVVCTDSRADCSASEGDVQVTVNYTRVVPLPFLGHKTISLHFSPSAKESLQPANWGS